MIYIALGIGFTSAAFFLFLWLQRKALARNSGTGICIEIFSLDCQVVSTLKESFKNVATQHQATVLNEKETQESLMDSSCFEASLQLVGLNKPALDALNQHELPENTYAVLSMILEGEVERVERSDAEEQEHLFSLWQHIGHDENAITCLDRWIELEPDHPTPWRERGMLKRKIGLDKDGDRDLAKARELANS